MYPPEQAAAAAAAAHAAAAAAAGMGGPLGHPAGPQMLNNRHRFPAPQPQHNRQLSNR